MHKSIHTPQHQVLQVLLRELRLAAGLTQAEVGALIDEPQSLVSKIESGERRLDLVELRVVVHALGMSLEGFVTRFEAQLSELDA